MGGRMISPSMDDGGARQEATAIDSGPGSGACNHRAPTRERHEQCFLTFKRPLIQRAHIPNP